MISPVESKIKIGYCIKIFKIYSKSIETRSKYFLFPSKNLKNSINIVQYWTIIFVFKYSTNNFKTPTKKKEKKSKRIPLSACIRLIDMKENVQGVAKKTERRLHRRKGISLVFALLPFPRPSFFHLFSLSLPPHRLLPPNFTRTPLDFRSICRYTRPLFPLHPPLSPFIVGPRLPTWLRQFNNSQPAATPHLLICSEFLTASPLETVAKKPPSHFIPSPALPIVLLSSSFARTATSLLLLFSLSSPFHVQFGWNTRDDGGGKF